MDFFFLTLPPPILCHCLPYAPPFLTLTLISPIYLTFSLHLLSFTLGQITSVRPIFITKKFPIKCRVFLVACTRLYNPLCRSVRRSVRPSVRPSVRNTLLFFVVLRHFRVFYIILSHFKSF